MQDLMTNAERPLPLDSFDGSFFQVDVGPTNNRQSFHVHRNLLCHHSGYFAGILRSTSAESKTKTHQLIVEDPFIFRIFVYWLYTRQIPTPDEDVHHSWATICQLWVFGEARQIPLLQNATIALFVRTAVELKAVPTAQVNWIYARTLPNSPLRRIFIELASRTVGRRILSEAKSWPKEALVDLATANWADRKTTPAAELLDTLDIGDYYVNVRSD